MIDAVSAIEHQLHIIADQCDHDRDIHESLQQDEDAFQLRIPKGMFLAYRPVEQRHDEHRQRDDQKLDRVKHRIGQHGL